jgi:hypothetical protein
MRTRPVYQGGAAASVCARQPLPSPPWSCPCAWSCPFGTWAGGVVVVVVVVVVGATEAPLDTVVGVVVAGGAVVGEPPLPSSATPPSANASAAATSTGDPSMQPHVVGVVHVARRAGTEPRAELVSLAQHAVVYPPASAR